MTLDRGDSGQAEQGPPPTDAALWRLAHRAALAVLGDRHAAEDVAQEAVLKLHEQPEANPIVNQGAWLWGVATRIANNYRRKKRPASFSEVGGAGEGWFDPPARGSASPAELAADEEMKGRLKGALALLSQHDRDIITLRYHEDLGNQEAAGALGISATAAANRHTRAVGHLRGLMEG